MRHRPRLLALIGSGETAPTMAKVHRLLAERFGPRPVDAVLLDTPYGFQGNAEEISRRAVGYFGRNLQLPLRVVSWRSPACDVWQREQVLASVRDADIVFAGPGSPTYALRVWKDSGLRDVLAGKLAHGGCVTFGSAAAASLGIASAPVYEIYKVGTDPHWLDGLDLLAVLGLRAAVLPHFDNAEGGTHDTRFCYLGEQRLQRMEAMLDATTCVLGIDEHTAGVFDLDADTLSVLGRGAVTIRSKGVSTVFDSGCTARLDEVRAIAAGNCSDTANAYHSGRSSGTDHGARTLPSLDAEAQRLQRAFDAALRARDPSELIAPFVDTLVELRDRARAQRSWAIADEVRERLATAGIEVRDTPEGTIWALPSC